MPPLQGDAAAGAAARRAPRRDGDRVLVGDGHDLRHLLRRCGPDDQIGLVRRQQRHKGRVVGVAETVEVGIEDVFRAHDIADLFLDLFRDHAACLP